MGKINTDNYPNRPFASYQDDDMFILQDNGGETYTTNVGDIKNLADSRIKLEGVQVNGSDLPISGKKVNVDISGKTDLSVIAYTFNSEMGYFKGAYVTYNGKLYEFIQEHTGAWNPSHVREIRASGQYVRTGNGGYNNGDRATCEGYMTKASGNYSHAEGRETQAVGDCTHAEGRETIANGIYQHVEGKYNIADNESNYIHIIGNGIDDNNRSNALTLDWDGNLEVSGEVEDGNGEKISDKTDKVTNATSGHLAGLDSNGNLTDSGVSPTEDVTVEGNPVTFDSPFEQDAKSVVVSVKPIQDLHGLPFPYVGGVYKNKLETKTTSYSASGVTVNVDSDGTVSLDGTASANVFIRINDNVPLPSGNYILSGCPSGGGGSTYRLYSQDSQGGHVVFDNGSGATITYDESYTLQVLIAVYNGANVSGKVFKPMIRLATESDATFAPYSNECPISGIDEVKIPVTGKNLLPCTAQTKEQNGVTWTVNADKSITPSGTPTANSIIEIGTAPVNAGMGNVRLSGLADTQNVSWNQLLLRMKDGSERDISPGLSMDDQIINLSEYPNVVGLVVEIKRRQNNTPCSGTARVMLELGITASAYEPFKGSTTTIPLPSTLYGGDVDVTEGSADSRFGFISGSSISDLQAWATAHGVTFRTTTTDDGNLRVEFAGIAEPVSDTITPSLSILKCNELENVSDSDMYWEPISGVTIQHDGDVRFAVNGITTEADMTTWLTANPIQIAYKLATPTTLSFTPTDVELLEGTNVVSTNAEKVAVKYGRSLWQDIDDLKTDTEGKLDKSDVATIEGDTASRAYSVNDFMLRADGLYKVTAPIAQNASITASNTTKTTIGAVLTALLNS